MTTTQPDAILTTPAEAAYCPRCDVYGGVRHTEHFPTFAHCPECGSTDLLDMRSIFEVAADQALLSAEEDVPVEVRWNRQDEARRLFVKAMDADRDHCSDCAEQARRMDRVFRALMGGAR